MYWRSVQPCWLAEKAFGYGNQVQVNCPFSPVLGLFHWKANMGWFCGARQMQKNVSLRSRQEKNFALAEIRPKSIYGFGPQGVK
jgi:hypothetical protein